MKTIQYCDPCHPHTPGQDAGPRHQRIEGVLGSEEIEAVGETDDAEHPADWFSGRREAITTPTIGKARNASVYQVFADGE
jgi:hypothetical protein